MPLTCAGISHYLAPIERQECRFYEGGDIGYTFLGYLKNVRMRGLTTFEP